MHTSAIKGPDESVQYMDRSPQVTVYRGGSRSWRTHNPGEIGHGLFALRHNAIGKFAGIAIFRSESEGDKALMAYLASQELAYLTLEQAYKRFDVSYEPQPQPNPSGQQPPPPPQDPYTGKDATVRMNSLSGGDRQKMAKAIKYDLIGWTPGTLSEESLSSGSLNESRRSDNKNVLINGRTAVHAGSQGVLTTPDVCETPSGDSCPPVLYTNIARSEDADQTAGSVLINGNEACVKSSTFKVSTGDEPGVCGGIRSGTTTGKAEFITASQDVTIEGEQAPRQFDLMVSNERNTPPMPLMQPGGAPPPEVEALDSEALQASERPGGPEVGFAGSRHGDDLAFIERRDEASS